MEVTPAQIPGAEAVVESASAHGWEAALLAVIILAGAGLLGYLIRMWVHKSTEREDRILQQAVDREGRLAQRVSQLEDFVRTALLDALKESSRAVSAISDSAKEQSKALNDLNASIRETTHELSKQIQHLGESLLRLEKQMYDHDANVAMNIERAAKGYATAANSEQKVR